MDEMYHLRDEVAQRKDAARRLHDTIQDQTSVSFDRMASIAAGMKSANPELAKKIDRVIGRSMLRAIQMPDAMAALFMAQTEPPSIVVEGEIVEDSSSDAEEEREESDE